MPKTEKIIEISEKPDYNSTEYRRSRAAYTAQCTIYYFVTLLVTDAFLAKLLESVGISDSLIGIISSFISLAFITQILSVFLVKLKISAKKTVIFFDTLSIFFFMLMYLVPFMPIGKTGKTVLIIICVIAAYAGNYLISSICFKWANSYVDPQKRAAFSATKEIISLISGMVFTAVVGYIIDRFEGIGNRDGGFLFTACAVLILNICNLICYMLIKKDSEDEIKSGSKSASDVLKNTVGNADFRNVIILTVLWDVARYFTVGFIGIFKTKDLMISLFTVQIINTAANFLRMIISKPFGRYSDRSSYAKGFELGLCLAAGAFLINAFTTKSTWFLIVIYTVLYNCCLAGTNQNSFNITYSYVDSCYLTQAMAIKNSIGGICGFAASVVAGKILSAIQANGNMIFGLKIYGQQLLSVISFIITVIAIIFTKTVIEKQVIKSQ